MSRQVERLFLMLWTSKNSFFNKVEPSVIFKYFGRIYSLQMLINDSA